MFAAICPSGLLGVKDKWCTKHRVIKTKKHFLIFKAMGWSLGLLSSINSFTSDTQL